MRRKNHSSEPVFQNRQTALLAMWLLLILFTLPHQVFSSAKGGESLRRTQGAYSVYGQTAIKAGLSFPPFAHEEHRAFTIKAMQDLSIDRVRIAIDWREREAQQGSFAWKPMDERMQAAKENDIKVFLTIASVAPAWAIQPNTTGSTNLFDEYALERFMQELLVRYDNIDKIQFGNEWEAGSDGYTDWEGIRKFVLYTNMLYEAVQKYAPQTEVVLGGLTRLYSLMELGEPNLDLDRIQLARNWTQERLMQRMARDREEYMRVETKAHVEYVLEHASYDVLDVHLYDDAENWPAYLALLPKGVPIVVSEFGGPSSEFEQTDKRYHAMRMDAYIDAIESLPITEAYYFKLVDSDESYHKHSGLYTKRLKKKPAYTVFKERLSPRT
ncbi:MAG: cellulase family glycosylhydrolase [Sphaerochaeta sp.]|nr:cellulase family glycosylhydrolase [Sphaerochaeta sp.]